MSCHLLVNLGKNHLSTTPMTEDEDSSLTRSQLATVKHITQIEKSAAGIVCELKFGTHAGSTCTNDVLGVVATLGKVNDDKLSRLVTLIDHFYIRFLATQHCCILYWWFDKILCALLKVCGSDI